MKYPRIPHFPWSKGYTVDDERLVNIDALTGKHLIYTEKLDGENTVVSSERVHARSEDGYGQPWQTYMLREAAAFQYDIPDGMFVCGENMYAVHSIEYEELTHYFYVFNIVFNGVVLSWDDTCSWADVLGVPTVPVIDVGVVTELPIPKESEFGTTCEGYVARNADAFGVSDPYFKENIAKNVRKGHVQTDEHWTKNWRKATLVGDR